MMCILVVCRRRYRTVLVASFGRTYERNLQFWLCSLNSECVSSRRVLGLWFAFIAFVGIDRHPLACAKCLHRGTDQTLEISVC